MTTVHVRVPASSANLGPGFDCVALAFMLWNRITIEESAQPGVEWLEASTYRRIDPAPFDSSILPSAQDNLVLRAIQVAFQTARRRPPPFRVVIRNLIPISRGLGSSAAAVAGGLVAANAWMGGPLSPQTLLELATRMEGHPDNASAALLGGLTVSAADGDRVITRRIDPPRGWRAVLFIPAQHLVTRAARAVLPRRVTRADAIYNLGRTGLLVHAFEASDADALDEAMRDCLHQPHRAQLIPGMEELFAAARRAGARGVALSGAGPAVLAMAESQAQAERVREALAREARRLKIPGSAIVLRLARSGAQVRIQA